MVPNGRQAVRGRVGRHFCGDDFLIGDLAHQGELFVGDVAVAIFVRVGEHVFHFLVIDVFRQAHHDGSKL